MARYVPVTSTSRLPPGAEVFGATINKTGGFRFEATKVGKDTALQQIVKLVQDAQGSKAPIARLADVVSGIFTPIVLSIAVATFAAWFVFAPEEHRFAMALVSAIAVLIIACPCALGLSVPLAMSVALLRAARAGIFIKNPDAIERLQHVQTVILDKTGTLTEGHATVARWHGSDVARDLACALEAQSSHRVARAFQHASGHTLHLVRRVEHVVEAPGLGIDGRLRASTTSLGSDELELPRIATLLSVGGALLVDGTDRGQRFAERLEPAEQQ